MRPPCASTIWRATASPRPVPRVARGEEGLEDARRAARLGNARAGVGDVDLDHAVARRARRAAPRRRAGTASTAFDEQAEQHLARSGRRRPGRERQRAGLVAHDADLLGVELLAREQQRAGRTAIVDGDRPRREPQRPGEARAATMTTLLRRSISAVMNEHARCASASAGGKLSPRPCAAERMTASGLRTSCAIAAASWPSAASFSLCARRARVAVDRSPSAPR